MQADDTKPGDETAAAAAQAVTGAGGGGQPPGPDAGAGAPPSAGADGAQGEAKAEAEDLDPRLAAVKPTFTIDKAFDRALGASYARRSGLIASDDAAHLRIVFDRIGRFGPMPVETAWRMLHTDGMQIPPWAERDLDGELDLTVFVAISRPLIDLATAQQIRFDELEHQLRGEARLGDMLKRRAGRRARKIEKREKRAKGMQTMKQIRIANELANSGKPAKTPAKIKAPAKTAPKKGGK